jgi:hypothetical protein
MGPETVTGEGTVWIGTADGWTDIGRTDGAEFEFSPLEMPGLDDERPFARLTALTVSVTGPLTRAGLLWAIDMAEDALRTAEAGEMQGWQDFIRAAKAQLAAFEGEG